MDPLPPSPTMIALASARRLLADAGLELLAVRRRVEVLADATEWRSRATAGYRAGVATLADELDRLVRLLDMSDAELISAQRDARLRSTVQW